MISAQLGEFRFHPATLQLEQVISIRRVLADFCHCGGNFSLVHKFGASDVFE